MFQDFALKIVSIAQLASSLLLTHGHSYIHARLPTQAPVELMFSFSCFFFSSTISSTFFYISAVVLCSLLTRQWWMYCYVAWYIDDKVWILPLLEMDCIPSSGYQIFVSFSTLKIGIFMQGFSGEVLQPLIKLSFKASLNELRL